jgi:hypothetical protein
MHNFIPICSHLSSHLISPHLSNLISPISYLSSHFVSSNIIFISGDVHLAYVNDRQSLSVATGAFEAKVHTFLSFPTHYNIFIFICMYFIYYISCIFCMYCIYYIYCMYLDMIIIIVLPAFSIMFFLSIF